MPAATDDRDETIRFGRFTLRPSARVLLVDERSVPLGARAFDLLQALIDRRDRVVGKSELLDLVWPGLVVEENNLTVQVSVLRKLLGPQAIATVHRRGYRFTASLKPLETSGATADTPNNLPRHVTSFVGRERELAEVDELLADLRLLSIVGIGGIGKTRLATAVARRHERDFPDGIWFVDLAPLVDAASVVRAAARSLNVPERPERALIDAVCEHAASRRLLLVLDNCEHLHEACQRFAQAWLGATRAPTLLVTSREALHIDGECCYALPALALPDPAARLDEIEATPAVRLFVERARQHQPQFQLGPTQAAGVARLCIHLDGIPLALELAAARIAVMSVEQILDRLDDRFRLLTGGNPAALARHQTLLATLDWSHALLTPPERLLYARLAAFSGSFTLEAAQGICTDPGLDEWNLLDALTSLSRKSLVLLERGAQGNRFRLLETVRQHALDRLRESGTEAAWLERHLTWYTALAEKIEPQLVSSGQSTAFTLLDAEHDNLRAALRHAPGRGDSTEAGLRLASAIWRFWSVRGYRVEGRNLLEALLMAAPSAQATAVRAKALNALGNLAWEQGDKDAATVAHGASLAIRRRLGDRTGIAGSLNNLGNLKLADNDFAAARALHEESLALRRESGDRTGESASLSNLGITASGSGDTPEAIRLLEQSLTLDRMLGDRRAMAVKLNNLGVQHELEDDFSAARRLYEESLAIRRELGDRSGIASSLGSLGGVTRKQGDCLGARALHRESLAIQRELDDRRGMAFSLEGLAAVALGMQEVVRAAHLWGAAEQLRMEIGVPLPARMRPAYEQAVAAARQLMERGASFDDAWRHGRLMGRDEVIAYALGQAPG